MQVHKFYSPLKGLFLITALLVLLIFNASNSFADFYVIAGSRGVGTKITSMPYTIASPGFYFIAKDLSCAAGTHGITITANNVTLDLMGFSLIGPGGSSFYNGIHMDGRANVEIRNGTVRNFGHRGIGEVDAAGTGHRIINIRVNDNHERGIYLSGRSHLVEKCTAVNNGYGIFVRYGSVVTGNTCYSNDNSGIAVSFGSTVTGNTCYNNGGSGISVSTSTVIGNTSYDNSSYGIYLDGNCLVDQNTAYSNANNMNTCGTCTFGTNHAP